MLSQRPRSNPADSGDEGLPARREAIRERPPGILGRAEAGAIGGGRPPTSPSGRSWPRSGARAAAIASTSGNPTRRRAKPARSPTDQAREPMLAARDRRRRGRGLKSEATANRRARVDAAIVGLLFCRTCWRSTASVLSTDTDPGRVEAQPAAAAAARAPSVSDRSPFRAWSPAGTRVLGRASA